MSAPCMARRRTYRRIRGRCCCTEYAAADAFPLSGVADLAAFDARLVSGQPTIVPRLTAVPVRMPLPPAPHQGSIYENQASAKNRYFGRKDAA